MERSDDNPRFLLADDINYILTNYLNNKISTLYFPESPKTDKNSRQCMIDWIVSRLKMIQIRPSFVPKLLDRIIQAHYKGLIIPDMPVSICAGRAVGVPTIQMELNSVVPRE